MVSLYAVLSLRDSTAIVHAAALSTATILLLLLALPANARMHKCIDAQGKVTYSDTLCPETRQAERTTAAIESPKRITRERVESLMAAADDAGRRKDVDKIMSYYAEDATVEVVVRLAHRTGRQTFRKRDLYEMAKRHKAEWSEYNARRENVAVEIARSGAQAEIRSKLVESWAQNGKRFMMASEEQHLLELREGGLLIVRSNVSTEGGPKEQH